MPFWKTTDIPLVECLHGHIYKVRSRNLLYGVWDEQSKGFIGIREKFGFRYLSTEYHYETGAPHGTACPEVDLGPVPEGVEVFERQYERSDQSNLTSTSNSKLFNALNVLDLQDRITSQRERGFNKDLLEHYESLLAETKNAM